jgi:hypothetical protein
VSADELDCKSTPTKEGDGLRAGDKEEEQSGLVPLLQQMSFAELREIARQRDWRVAGTGKADYVSALASLLCDPTETARAVTAMPENLREALRAALIADDGTGITATAMAQTMTALGAPRPYPLLGVRSAPATRSQDAVRPGSGRLPAPSTGPLGGESVLHPAFLAGRERGPAVKPVEAAALLIDLARWGLVLPWRDSLFGQGRHVLPWHVQRQLPPLAGWCPPTAQTPAIPPSTRDALAISTRSRDARQFVSSLYGVWEAIAAERPAVQPAAPSGAEEIPVAQIPRTPPTLPTPPNARGGVADGHPVERRLQSLLQGWPYEPQELQAWAGNRRRAETSTQSLSVPPPPFLIEDAALPTLAHQTQGDGHSLAVGTPSRVSATAHRVLDGVGGAGDGFEELEFECRLLCEMGLVRIEDGHLQAQREQMAGFLRRPLADQYRHAAQAYLSLLDWSELNLLLRNNPRLVLWRRPYFAIPYDQFRSSLVRLRHLLLRFLACAGEQGWCELSAVKAALRELWPHFPAALQSERESWFTQAWGLAWRSRGRDSGASEPSPQRAVSPRQAVVSGLNEDAGAIGATRPYPLSGAGTAKIAGRGTEPVEARHLPASRLPADWEASQGALLRQMLEGPLYWLGFVELGYREGQLAAFRLHGLADWIWDRPAAPFELEGRPQQALQIDEATHTISLHPRSVAPEALAFLGRVARLEQARPERFVYHLQPRAVISAFESGASLTDLFAEWERVMPQAMPSALQETLSRWWIRYGQVRLYDGFGLLELRDEVTLRELEAGTSLSQHIVARLSPRMVLVRDEAVDGLLKEFAAKGYTPKEVD